MYGSISFDRNTLDSGVSATTGNASLKEDDTGVSLLVGFPVQPQLDVEVFYKDLGETSLTAGNGDSFVLEGETFNLTGNLGIKASGTAIGIGGRYRFDVSESFTPFVKGGFLRWDLDGSVSAGTTTASVSDDDTDAYFGLGALVPLTEQLFVRSEYMQFEDFSGLSVGIESKF